MILTTPSRPLWLPSHQPTWAAMPQQRQRSLHRACCCGPCSTFSDLSITVTAGTRCDPCYIGAGVPGPGAGWQCTSLAVDGTYAIPYDGLVSGSVHDWEDTPTVADAAHLKNYFQFAAACTGTLLYEHDCDDVIISVRLDCADTNEDGQPRVLIAAVRVRFENCHGDRGAGEDWQDGYGNYINSPASWVFRYDQGLHGGTYYLGDTVSNGETSCVDSQLAHGGTVLVEAA